MQFKQKTFEQDVIDEVCESVKAFEALRECLNGKITRDQYWDRIARIHDQATVELAQRNQSRDFRLEEEGELAEMYEEGRS